MRKHPEVLAGLDRDHDGRLNKEELDGALDAALAWARRATDPKSAWYYVQEGRWIGPKQWLALEEAAKDQPALPVNLEREGRWLPFGLLARAVEAVVETDADSENVH
jgi:hypothetical protein